MITVGYSNWLEWCEQNMLTCQVKAATGFECMGCGMQRSAILLLKGQLWESFLMYPPLIPLILLIGTLLAHLKYNWNHGALFIKWNFIVVVILSLGHYLFKII